MIARHPHSYLTYDRSRQICLVNVTALAMLIFVVVPSGLTAERDDAPAILVVNSDPSIGRYRLAEKGFLEAVAAETAHVNLEPGVPAEVKLNRKVESMDPKIIYCVGSRAYHAVAAMDVQATIIVSSMLQLDMIKPDKRVFGVHNAPPQRSQLVMMRHLFPDLRRIGVAYSRKHNQHWLKSAAREADEVQFKIIGIRVSNSAEVVPKLLEKRNDIDALWLIPDPVVMNSTDTILSIFDHCHIGNKPVLAYDEIYARIGATLVISVDAPTVGRQSAGIASMILDERQISNRFQHPIGTRIALNRDKTKRYGLHLNKHALGSVDDFIQ